MLRCLILFCVLAAVLLSACQAVPPLVVPAPTTPLQTVEAPPTAQPPAATPQPSATPQLSTNTSMPSTNTPPPPTNTPPPPTNTSLPPANTSLPPANTPLPAPTKAAALTDTPQPTNTPAPAAVVRSTTLNLRQGPGTDFGVLTAAKQGDTLNLVGQVQNCAWFKVTTAGGLTGWVSGGADYVTVTVACAVVPAAEAPPTPAKAVPPPTTAASKRPAPSPTPAGSLLSVGKGCILLENYLGVELNVTLTTGGTAENFKVAPMGKYTTCLNPGHYDYTLDAPPPFGSANGIFDVVAGKQFRFPVTSLP